MGVGQACGEDGGEREALIEVLFAVVEGGDREVAGGAIEGEDEVLDIVGVELGAEGFEEPAVEFCQIVRS